MNAQDKERLRRVIIEKIKRSKELIAHADVLGIEIGFEGEYTTFHPMDITPPKFVEEATILSWYIRAIKEGRIK